MSILKNIREQQNLTQEELAEKSSISVRTIQRIEAGTKPKGYTLRTLAKTLNIPESELLVNEEVQQNNFNEEQAEDKKEQDYIQYSHIKIINLSSIPFIIFPPLNILVPLFLMFRMNQKNDIVKQIISIQILWTIAAPIFFMLGIFLKLGNTFALLLMIFIVLSNLFIIIRNAIGIDRQKKLYYNLNFSMI